MSHNVDAYALQKCRPCQQEIDDQLPNLEEQLEEMRILEEPDRGGSTVSGLPDLPFAFLIIH
jgi:hypothetical protein